MISSPLGSPGIAPRWTSSKKNGVGTAMTSDCNVWFTISHGIVNEVFFPRTDFANTRDIELLVASGSDFFSEEKRHTEHSFKVAEDGIPAFDLKNTCREGRYQIEKKIITDPKRNVLLQKIVFTPIKGSLKDYRLYVLLTPHVANCGSGNTGWNEIYKGFPMLFAHRAGIALALSCSQPFLKMSCGYVGENDPWHDIAINKKMTQTFSRVEDGNIALIGEIDLIKCQGEFVLSLGFGENADEAAVQARTSLLENFDSVWTEYVDSWKKIQKNFIDLSSANKEAGKIYRTSLAVLKTHENKKLVGSLIPSLSIPWGFTKGDLELGNYHRIWPRDCVQAALAYIAAGDINSARQILLFLMSIQESDGHWLECVWADGNPCSKKLQIDETALPILLADRLSKINGLDGIDPWPMISNAAKFLIQQGPFSDHDRWEEGVGYNPYSLGSEIAALLAAADFFDRQKKNAAAEYLREIADFWNDNIEHWLYVKDTALAHHNDVDGYYVRFAPQETFIEKVPFNHNRQIVIQNKPEGQNIELYTESISVDALALVRFGLRSPEDPRILNTLKVIDALLKVETSKGPVWHRYNEDGYGEKADGSPFDGTGIGRGWPLLTGERAHFELARGNKEEALQLCKTMANFAGESGLIPEQIWDSPDIPSKGLNNGQAAGSARPLVWAHAEYINLLRSLKEGSIFHLPPQTLQRYLREKTVSKYIVWRPNHLFNTIVAGKKLRIQTEYPARIRWTLDNWKTANDTDLKDTVYEDLGIYYIDLPTQDLAVEGQVIFTFYWLLTKSWEGKNFELTVTS